MKKAPLTKEQFVHYINFIKERKEEESKINKLFTTAFEDSIFYPYTRYETELIYLLEDVMQDKEGNINYFIYDLDFGTEGMAKDCITESDGTKISLTSAEELYDYLVRD